MKTVDLEQATLDGCIHDSQHERVIITRQGKPVALMIGIESMDEEQLQLGESDRFWALIAERRRESTVSRAKLEEEINNAR